MIIRDDNGGVKELLGYTYDITATKKSEENLQTTLKNLEWKNKELENLAHKLELQIKERTLIEKMLRESEEKFRSLSESAKDGIIILDSKGDITYWNKGAEEIFGYSSEEILDKEFHRLITTKKMYEEHKSKMEDFRRSGTGGLIGKIIEIPAIHKSGKTIDVEVSLSAVQIQNEWNAIGIVRDITERKKAEQKLAELNDALNLSNIEKDKFFSIIAHDLKGPLGGLIGLSELMAEDIETIEKDELIEIAQNFHSSLKNIYKLLENLLDWSRLQRNTIQFNPEVTNLRLLSNNTAQILKAALSNKKISLVNNIPEDVFVYADENMVSTILRNLINNSIKFTNADGVITLSARESDDGKVVVSVKDTGIGMDAEHQKNLFKIGNNYSRLGTENEQGTGLGLILCKEFVNKNGGEIWVESTEGQGTEFFFTLPKGKK
jgi:PAS domain S-box-containing protein